MNKDIKTEIERLTPGTVQFRLPEGWPEQYKQPTIDLIAEVIRYAAEVVKVPLRPLRCVQVAADFPAEVAAWQRLLGRIEGVSDSEESIVVGKMLGWQPDGDDDPENACALVLLHFSPVLDACEGHNQWVRGALLHELGHVRDRYMMGVAGYADVLHPAINNIQGLRAYIAWLLWGEYVAELVGAMLHDATAYPKIAMSSHASNIRDAVKASRAIVKRLRWTTRGDLDPDSWNEILANVGRIAAGAGRALGALESLSDPGPSYALLIDVLAEFEDVRELLADAATVLGEMNELAYGWGPDPWKRLYPIVDRMFEAAGVKPQITNGKTGTFFVHFL
jgi:hypothetical protein